ncbi:MAG TPA: serine/threonine-protein kinase [Candidatus Deferrimicrobium sp.]|nr:serine/threonine-protein kinase [Candidatus Deferrimicrobium sp.]
MNEFPEIPGYKLISVLSTGGIARVYLGIQQKLNRKVAVKILKPFFLKDTDTAERFEREAKTAAMLTHSNIVQIYDTGVIGEYHYIVMEYLEESLRERLKREHQKKMNPEIALSIVEEIFKALDYAHFRGVYHRDLKPENIMFRHDSTPVLVDFGIARLYDASIRLTESDMIIGTIYYMSPEQCNAETDIDGRTDTYSLGVVLFEMISGKLPYKKGEGIISIIQKHIEDPVPKLPADLIHYQPLIDKMMAKDKKDRISSAPEFAALLNSINKT